ncbi:MAG: hypothetical protein AABX01_02685, partial [Candidatus Micrarchaeota archaeon]
MSSTPSNLQKHAKWKGKKILVIGSG